MPRSSKRKVVNGLEQLEARDLAANLSAFQVTVGCWPPGPTPVQLSQVSNQLTQSSTQFSLASNPNPDDSTEPTARFGGHVVVGLITP
jgi:hypothetical protein